MEGRLRLRRVCAGPRGSIHGPYEPESGTIPLGTYRRWRKTERDKRIEKVEHWAEGLSIPRAAMSRDRRSEEARSRRFNLPSIPCCPGAPRWAFDPDVIQVKGKRYIYYGSYFGGISVRALSPDGLTSDPSSQTQSAVPNRYESAHVIKRGRFFYLFASVMNCCNGPLTGYSVFVGRSISPLRPFVDRQVVSFLDARVGGLPVLSMNGNRWVGPGGTAMFRDFGGQDWTVYQAVDRFDPYFEGAPTSAHVNNSGMRCARFGTTSVTPNESRPKTGR